MMSPVRPASVFSRAVWIARGGLYHRLHAMNVASFDDVPAELSRGTADRRT